MKKTSLFSRVQGTFPARLALVWMVAGMALAQKPAPVQPNDEEYTKKIKEYLNDPRFTTELVDHLPASSTVPTPLKFLGKMPGQPGELYYSDEINSYYEELAKVSPRAKFWKLPLKTEEGRDMVVLAIANEDDDQEPRQVQGRSGGADRPAQDDGGRSAEDHPYREADLLDYQRHPLARDRRPADAGGAGVPADRRRDAVHPGDSQQRDRVHHAGD